MDSKVSIVALFGEKIFLLLESVQALDLLYLDLLLFVLQQKKRFQPCQRRRDDDDEQGAVRVCVWAAWCACKGALMNLGR
jgi:hypothetical protein